MAKHCEFCAKKTTHGNNVSHATNRTKRTWAPNIQRVHAIVNGTPRTVYACTRCLRSGLVQRSV